MEIRRRKWTGIPVVLILAGMLLIGGISASEFAPWSIQTVDSGGQVGQYSSVAMDAAGNPAISYYDQTYGDLMYASWDGSKWIKTTVDCSRSESKNKWYFWDRGHDRTRDSDYIRCFHGTEKVGKHSSLAFDSNGKPRISYYDESKGDLKYASWDGSKWIITTVDNSGRVGEYSSLAFDSAAKPKISYYDESEGDLNYASWDGSRWVITTVDGSSDNHGQKRTTWDGDRGRYDDRSKKVGEFSSLALDGSDKPRISYYDETNKDLKYAAWDGSKWVVTTIDGLKNGEGQKKNHWDGDRGRYDESSKKVGKYSSLALDDSGKPRISYYDESNKDLKYAAWDGTRWVITTVDSSKRVGEYASLELDANGDPRISYYDATHGDLKFAAWNRVTSRWVTETVDSSGKVGSFSSLSLDSLGNPRISYYDQSNKDLKYTGGTGHVQIPTAPTVTAITPASGIAGNPVQVNLTGTNFVAGTSPVVWLAKSGSLNITASGVAVVSPTLITCTLTLPAGASAAGLWDFVVRNADGQSGTMASAFTVTNPVPAPAPTVTGITPGSGTAGNPVQVTLTGTNFVAGTTPTVWLAKSGSLNITATDVTVVSPTVISCTLPLPAGSASAGQWDVVVKNVDGQYGILATGFTVTNPAPTVTAITPSSGVAGSQLSGVSITGTDFVMDTIPSVWLAKTAEDNITATNVAVVSPTQITCTLSLSPYKATVPGQWDLVVKNADGKSGSKNAAFTITNPPPMISSISPQSGSNGTIIDIVKVTGNNFGFGANPDIWLAKAGETNIIASDTQIFGTTELKFRLNIPRSAPAGQWDLMVQSKDGQTGAYLGMFTITPQIPTTLTWDWSTQTGWDGWQFETTCSGTATKPCSAYGPVLETGYGEYGSKLTPESGSSTKSSVTRTFTAPPGTTWNTLTFSGMLSPSAADYSRSMTINVNGLNVYSATAQEDPAINGQQFTITKTFEPANEVTVIISGKQDPIFETDPTLYTIQFNSLTLN